MGKVKIRTDKWNNTCDFQNTIYEFDDVLAVEYDAPIRRLTLLHQCEDYSITLDVPKGYEIITDKIPMHNINIH